MMSASTQGDSAIYENAQWVDAVHFMDDKG